MDIDFMNISLETQQILTALFELPEFEPWKTHPDRLTLEWQGSDKVWLKISKTPGVPITLTHCYIGTNFVTELNARLLRVVKLAAIESGGPEGGSIAIYFQPLE